jgi:hypothetical protein
MNSFPSPAKPLDSVVTLAQSSSCSHLPVQDDSTAAPRSPTGGGARGGVHAAAEQQLPQTPRAAYTSPAHKAIHAVALYSPHAPYTSSARFLLGGAMSDTNSAHSNSRTRAPFRPQKAGKGSTNYQLKQFAEATLGSGSLRKAVKLPEGEDKDEWLAVNCGFMIRRCDVDIEGNGIANMDGAQASISTTRSTCCMAPSPSSAAHRTALR